MEKRIKDNIELALQFVKVGGGIYLIYLVRELISLIKNQCL